MTVVSFNIQLVTSLNLTNDVVIGDAAITVEQVLSMRLRLSVIDGEFWSESTNMTDLFNSLDMYLTANHDYNLNEEQAKEFLKFVVSCLEDGQQSFQVNVNLPETTPA